MARQGDLRQALELFHSLDPASGSQLDHDLAVRYQQRFVLRDEPGASHSENPFIQDLLKIYTTYWTRSLLGEFDFEAGKKWLETELHILLVNHDLKELLENGSDTMSALGQALSEQGLYFDHSLASPWYDLLLWKSQQQQRFEVDLADQRVELDVVFMDDFISLGWADFATLGMTSSAGWAASDAIYCVSWAWDHDSENFRVSFLQHEGRHFADFKSYPRLGVIDLEYRAKLTELAFADTTLFRILANFSVNSAPNPESPHAYANYLVIHNLYRAVFDMDLTAESPPWSRAPKDKINQAAAELLMAHTDRLIEAGASETTGVLIE